MGFVDTCTAGSTDMVSGIGAVAETSELVREGTIAGERVVASTGMIGVVDPVEIRLAFHWS